MAGSDSQRGLIDFNRVAFQQARIRRHDVAQANANDVARHKLTRRRRDPLPLASDASLDRQLRLQGGDRVARLVFLPESDHGVGKTQKQDDKNVRPVPDHRGQDHRSFDHPQIGTPKIA